MNKDGNIFHNANELSNANRAMLKNLRSALNNARRAAQNAEKAAVRAEGALILAEERAQKAANVSSPNKAKFVPFTGKGRWAATVRSRVLGKVLPNFNTLHPRIRGFRLAQAAEARAAAGRELAKKRNLEKEAANTRRKANAAARNAAAAQAELNRKAAQAAARARGVALREAEAEARRQRRLAEEARQWKETANELVNWGNKAAAKSIFASAAKIGKLKTAAHMGREAMGNKYNIQRQRSGNAARNAARERALARRRAAERKMQMALAPARQAAQRRMAASAVASLRAQRAMSPLFGPENMRTRPKRN